MNSYTKHHIEIFHHKYLTMQFDQDDITLFIMLTRDYSPQRSIFRELGDFIAHPDKKDRGILIDSFFPVTSFFDENTELFFHRENIFDNPIEPPEGFGDLRNIHQALSQIFDLVSLEIGPYDRDNNNFREFVFCLIFLLGNFRLQVNNKLHDLRIEYGHDLNLSISYESKSRRNNFLSISILFLDNVWIQANDFNRHELKNYIVRRFSNGCLGAINYMLDNENLPNNMQELEQGKVWPLFKT